MANHITLAGIDYFLDYFLILYDIIHYYLDLGQNCFRYALRMAKGGYHFIMKMRFLRHATHRRL